MLWEDYYDKIGDWATSTSISRMSQLESFGPPEEITEVILDIGFYDKKGATRLLKKATAAGVKFPGELLADLWLHCEKPALLKAVHFSSDRFGTEDLDALYCLCDDHILLDIAGKYGIPLPPDMANHLESIAEATEEEEDFTPGDLAEEYDHILICLARAHDQLHQAGKMAVIDTSSKRRAVTVSKYYYLLEAQTQITNALDAWYALSPRYRTKESLPDIRLNVPNSTMWQNYLFDGLFVNLSVRRQIRRTMEHIVQAMAIIRKLRNGL